MSVLLYDMRAEDINNTILLDDDNQQIPVDFIDNVLDKQVHQNIIKERIRMSVLEHVMQCPNAYNTDDNGDYTYTAPDTYDHAYLMDAYLQEVYADTQTKCVYMCTECQSDNVQVQAWVRPNQGMQYVDEVNEGDQMGWCDDCDQSVMVDTTEVKRRAKVIGFQVEGVHGTGGEGQMHPHMDASFCVYSLDQARSMLDDDNQGDERGWWKLLTIWTDDIEEPTMMFKGDPRA